MRLRGHLRRQLHKDTYFSLRWWENFDQLALVSTPHADKLSDKSQFTPTKMAEDFSPEVINQSMEDNRVDVLVLTPNQYMSILQDNAKGNRQVEQSLRSILANTEFGKYWNKTFNPNASEPWVGPAGLLGNDVVAIGKTLNAIGMAGVTSYVKTTPSGVYIIIKGFSAKRSAALQGTRYLATNPKMLQLGLGMKGLQGVAKGGFILGVVVSAGIEVVDFIFNDQKTMYDLIGGIGVEAVKAGLGALVAYGLAAGVGLVTTVAVTPLVIMAAVAFVAGLGLNYLDSKFQIKQQVIDALKATGSAVAQGIYYLKDAIDSMKRSVKEKTDEIGRNMYIDFLNYFCPICRGRY